MWHYHVLIGGHSTKYTHVLSANNRIGMHRPYRVIFRSPDKIPACTDSLTMLQQDVTMLLMAGFIYRYSSSNQSAYLPVTLFTQQLARCNEGYTLTELIGPNVDYAFHARSFVVTREQAQ